MNAIIEKIVKTILSNYIQELKDLEVKLFDGEVFLAEGRFDTDHINNILINLVPNLRIQSGRLKNMKVCIPWTSISTQSTVITIEELIIKINLIDLPISDKDNKKLPSILLSDDIDTQAQNNFLGNFLQNLRVNIFKLVLEVELLNQHCIFLELNGFEYGKSLIEEKMIVLRIEELICKHIFELINENDNSQRKINILQMHAESVDLSFESKKGMFRIRLDISKPTEVKIKSSYINKTLEAINFITETFAIHYDLSIITVIRMIETRQRQFFFDLTLFNIFFLMEHELIQSNQIFHFMVALENFRLNLQQLYPESKLRLAIDLQNLTIWFNNETILCVSKATDLPQTTLIKFMKCQIMDNIDPKYIFSIEYNPQIDHKFIKGYSKINIIGILIKLYILRLNSVLPDLEKFIILLLQTFQSDLKSISDNNNNNNNNATVLGLDKFRYLSFLEINLLQNVIELNFDIEKHVDQIKHFRIMAIARLSMKTRSSNIALKEMEIDGLIDQVILADSKNKNIMELLSTHISYSFHKKLQNTNIKSRLNLMNMIIDRHEAKENLMICMNIQQILKNCLEVNFEISSKMKKIDSSTSSSPQLLHVKPNRMKIYQEKVNPKTIIDIKIDSIKIHLGESINWDQNHNKSQIFKELIKLKLEEIPINIEITEFKSSIHLQTIIKSYLTHPVYDINETILENFLMSVEADLLRNNFKITFDKPLYLKLNLHFLPILIGFFQLFDNSYYTCYFRNYTDYDICLISSSLIKKSIHSLLKPNQKQAFQIYKQDYLRFLTLYQIECIFDQENHQIRDDNNADKAHLSEYFDVSEFDKMSSKEGNVSKTIGFTNLISNQTKYLVLSSRKSLDNDNISCGGNSKLYHEVAITAHTYYFNLLKEEFKIVITVDGINGPKNIETILESCQIQDSYSKLNIEQYTRENLQEIIKHSFAIYDPIEESTERRILLSRMSTKEFYTSDKKWLPDGTIQFYDIQNEGTPIFQFTYINIDGINVYILKNFLCILNNLSINASACLYNSEKNKSSNESIQFNEKSNETWIFEDEKFTVFHPYIHIQLTLNLDSNKTLFTTNPISFKGYSYGDNIMKERKSLYVNLYDSNDSNDDSLAHKYTINLKSSYNENLLVIELDYPLKIANESKWDILIRMHNTCNIRYNYMINDGESIMAMINLKQEKVLYISIIDDSKEIKGKEIILNIEDFLRNKHCLCSFNFIESTKSFYNAMLSLSLSNIDDCDILTISPIMILNNHTQFQINFGQFEIPKEEYKPICLMNSNDSMLNNKIYYYNDETYTYIFGKILEHVNFKNQRNIEIIDSFALSYVAEIPFEFQTNMLKLDTYTSFNVEYYDKVYVVSSSIEITNHNIIFHIYQNEINPSKDYLLLHNQSSNNIKFKIICNKKFCVRLEPNETSLICIKKSPKIFIADDESETYHEIIGEKTKLGIGLVILKQYKNILRVQYEGKDDIIHLSPTFLASPTPNPNKPKNTIEIQGFNTKIKIFDPSLNEWLAFNIITDNIYASTDVCDLKDVEFMIMQKTIANDIKQKVLTTNILLQFNFKILNPVLYKNLKICDASIELLIGKTNLLITKQFINFISKILKYSSANPLNAEQIQTEENISKSSSYSPGTSAIINRLEISSIELGLDLNIDSALNIKDTFIIPHYEISNSFFSISTLIKDIASFYTAEILSAIPSALLQFKSIPNPVALFGFIKENFNQMQKTEIQDFAMKKKSRLSKEFTLCRIEDNIKGRIIYETEIKFTKNFKHQQKILAFLTISNQNIIIRSGSLVHDMIPLIYLKSIKYHKNEKYCEFNVDKNIFYVVEFTERLDNASIRIISRTISGHLKK